MPRERTGSFDPWGKWPSGAPRFRYRLRLGDGSKTKHFDVPEGLAEKNARAYVRSMQSKEDALRELLAVKRERERETARKSGKAIAGETCDEWHARFMTAREAQMDVSHPRGRWRKWISPILGPKPIASVTREDIETVRDALDDAIAAFRESGRARKRTDRRLMPKAALNVWAVVTTAFKAACSAKRATGLRVRDDNPCVNVAPPEKGASRRKTWIYPSEFLQLVSCEAVPLEWRELYAIACYVYLRPGELFELRWRDVDADSHVVSVTRAWDWSKRMLKAPKTINGTRDVPIPPALRPLLARMREGKTLDAKVVPIMQETGENKGAALLRVHLELAGVTHPRLTEDTATRMPVGFRSWRDTGITWSAIDGVDVAKLQRRAGHDDVDTTLSYVKEAEDRGQLRGRVFPALPNALVWPSVRPSSAASSQENRLDSVPEEGVENRRPSDVDTVSRASVRDGDDESDEERRKPATAEAFGQAIGQGDEVEAALVRALDAATAAGRFDVVAQLAHELEARRRVEFPNVVQLRTRTRRDR